MSFNTNQPSTGADADFLREIGITADTLVTIPYALAVFERDLFARHFRVLSSDESGVVVRLLATSRTLSGFGADLGTVFHARATSTAAYGDLTLFEAGGMAWVGEFRGVSDSGSLLFAVAPGLKGIPSSATVFATLTKAEPSHIEQLQLGDEIVYRFPQCLQSVGETRHRGRVAKVTTQAYHIEFRGPKGGTHIHRIRFHELRSVQILIETVIPRSTP